MWMGPSTSLFRLSWFTPRRLRAHAIIVASCLWLVYAWTLATPGLRDRNGNLKGTDFLHFYTLGSLAASHRGVDLYDMDAQAQLAWQRVPQAAGLRYLPLYPPQVSILFAPLSYLPYGEALVLWWIFSVVIYAGCCYVIWRACPRLTGYGETVVLLAIAYPAFFHLIAWGQTSALALACFAAVFVFLRSGRQFAAGLALGCLIFKPQLGLAAALVFVSLGTWRTIAGAILSAGLQLAIGVFYYGVDPLRQWIHTLSDVRDVMPLLEPRPYQMHSLRTFWSMLVPWPDVAMGLYLISAVAMLGITVGVWRRNPSAPLALRFSSLLLATVLISPHLTVYDLVILTPALLLLADWIASKNSSAPPWMAVVLYFVYLLPLVGFLAEWTHVQLSVIAMSVCVYAIWEASRRTVVENATATL